MKSVKEVMKEFEENNPEQLKLFLTKLKYLVDDFHHNIYLLDGVFEGIELIDKTIKKQLNKE
jgi:hypothetical protein